MAAVQVFKYREVFRVTAEIFCLPSFTESVIVHMSSVYANVQITTLRLFFWDLID